MATLFNVYRFWTRLKNKAFTLLVRPGFNSFGSRSVISLPFRSGQEERISVGTGVFVGPDCWIEVVAPPDKDSDPLIVIEDGVSISGSCTITAVKHVRIGAGALIARFVHIADHSHAFSNFGMPIKEQGVANVAEVQIGEGAWIGHGVIICPGVTIGCNSVIGANSVVNESVPDHCVAAGAPARVLRHINPDKGSETMKRPLVSVIIPTYNRADTVARSIQSVLDQSYQPIEVIVVDDGSTDHTLRTLEGFGARIQVIQQENRGPSAARNSGVMHSKGEIIAFLDSDDTWGKAKLENQVRMMEAGGESVPCCICNADIVVGNVVENTSFKTAQVESHFKEGFWLNPSLLIATRFLLFNQVVAVRRTAFQAVGGFNEEMRLLEDHDLAFKLSLIGPWAFLSEPMVQKSNDSEGVGVLAMKEPLVHAQAWERVLNAFLDAPQAREGELGFIVRRNLRDITTELRAKRLTLQGDTGSRALGRFLLFTLRMKSGLRRRLPSWPRVRAVERLFHTADFEENTPSHVPISTSSN